MSQVSQNVNREDTHIQTDAIHASELEAALIAVTHANSPRETADAIEALKAVIAKIGGCRRAARLFVTGKPSPVKAVPKKAAKPFEINLLNHGDPFAECFHSNDQPRKPKSNAVALDNSPRSRAIRLDGFHHLFNANSISFLQTMKTYKTPLSKGQEKLLSDLEARARRHVAASA
jgi:hypothetical protein